MRVLLGKACRVNYVKCTWRGAQWAMLCFFLFLTFHGVGAVFLRFKVLLSPFVFFFCPLSTAMSILVVIIIQYFAHSLSERSVRAIMMIAAAAGPGTTLTAWYASGNEGSKKIAPALAERYTAPKPLSPFERVL